MLATLASLLLATGAAPAPREYQIDLVVSQTDPAAPRSEQKETILAEPRIVTTLGRPAVFRTGGQQLVMVFGERMSGPGLALAPFGVQVETTVTRTADGALRLEVSVEGRPATGGLRVFQPENVQKWQTTTLVRLGEAKQFRPAIDVGDGATGLRVTVSELPAKK